jgi:hypothetical protein
VSLRHLGVGLNKFVSIGSPEAKRSEMPGLETDIHLKMLQGASKQGQQDKQGIYGLHWGDPEDNPILKKVRDHWLLPYVHENHDAVEIGPGGGRWTRYMLKFRRIHAVDYHQELLDELKKNFSQDNLTLIKNNGTDFPGIGPRSIDFPSQGSNHRLLAGQL